ncbi:hypothetical protein WME95_48425 [Sorangium sp. So ce327]|uniref:hypothetical protein n=1 Tax=Sorangium sp. So ce327 TaxID=3133301 RepID=UPI003F5DB6D0
MSSGAHDDLGRATALVREMVTRLRMSRRLAAVADALVLKETLRGEELAQIAVASCDQGASLTGFPMMREDLVFRNL